VLSGAMLLLAYEVFYWFTHVYENDARVQTNFTDISAQVDGKIETIHVEEGGRVEQGQLLITLFHDDITLNIRSLRTDLALEQANRVNLASERDAFKDELRTKLETQREKIRALEDELRSVRERLKLARKDLSRMNVLVGKKLAPETKLIAEQDKMLVLQGRASFLQGSIAVAQRELDQIEATRKQLEIIINKIKISEIKEAKILNSIDQQNVFLDYRKIRSPISGVVGKIHRYKGEYIEDGINILMLHDPRLYWVEAYVDEDQIRHVRIGQEVLISLDAYPFEDFFGKVHHIGNVTTNGPGNTGGNGRTGKAGGSVERVPVRISLENPPPNVTPGMRAKVNVRIYENIKLW
jgi:membrane fusion protein (multidrug efflux system)